MELSDEEPQVKETTKSRLKKKSNVVEDSDITAMDIERNLRPEEVDENGDYVVGEYDVFLNQKLGSELALFQYPLRPNFIPFDNTQISDIRMKPNQYKIEMDFNIEKASKYYDAESEVDEVRKKFTLTSSNIPLQTNYAVGILKDGALHITPLHHATQFRPSFAYLDDLDAKKKTKKDSKKEEEEEPLPSHMEEESPLRLQVQFKRKENPKAAAARKKAEEKQAFEDEPWSNLTFLEKTEPESMNMYESLWSGSTNAIPAKVPKDKYLNGLNPLPVIEPWIAQAVEMATTSEGLSLEAIKKMPLEKQVSALLMHTHVMHFAKIVELATAATKPEDVLAAVEKIAMFLRGTWVVRSELVLESTRLKVTRDYILVMLHKNEFVKKHELQQVVKLPPDAIESILIKICVQTPNGWKLKLSPDEDFMTKHPQLVQKFEELWNTRGPKIEESLIRIANKQEITQGGKATGSTAATTSSTATVAPAAKTAPVSEDKFAGHTAKEQLEHFFLELFRKYGVCNFQFLKQHFVVRQQEKNSANLLGGVTDEMFRETLKSMTDCIQSAHFLVNTGNAGIDKFRTVVLGLFKQNLSLRKSDVKEACMKDLKEDIPQQTYLKILRELATCKGSLWILKAGDGTES